MILIPYPASKKEIKEYEAQLSYLFKAWIPLFFSIEVIASLILPLVYILDTREKLSALEYLASHVGAAGMVFLPSLLFSFFIAVIFLVIKKRKNKL